MIKVLIRIRQLACWWHMFLPPWGNCGYERVVNVKDLPSTGQTAENPVLNNISIDCTYCKSSHSPQWKRIPGWQPTHQDYPSCIKISHCMIQNHFLGIFFYVNHFCCHKYSKCKWWWKHCKSDPSNWGWFTHPSETINTEENYIQSSVSFYK